MFHEDEDRSDLVGEHVGVAGGGQVLARQGHDVQPGGQLVKEVRMTCSRCQRSTYTVTNQDPGCRRYTGFSGGQPFVDFTIHHQSLPWSFAYHAGVCKLPKG